MKCNNCHAILPSSYKVCPVCQSEELVRERFVENEPQEEIKKISPFVEIGEVKGDELK